ncbi:Pyruvate dehydrogenase E1 component subunit alpha-2, mitochondrial, partial [Dionaea muscipula]
MRTAEWRVAKSPAYDKRGDYVPALKLYGQLHVVIVIVIVMAVLDIYVVIVIFV